ncbi:hypothetical protein [Nesterenkonia pannonica]|nr:hypothetical protein [Nesterenkonia pannonica]
MAVPESDLKLIAAWCEEHTPEYVRDQVWTDYDVTHAMWTSWGA